MPRYVPQAASLYQSRGISTSLKWRLNESLYDRVARRDFASQTPKNTIIRQQSEPPPASGNRGILMKSDSTEKKLKSRSSVDFSSEEALVIGYGGNDYDSDTSPWEMGSDDGSIDFDLLDDTDEDRKITKLTKNNTEFNSFNENLLTADNTQNQVKKEEEKLNTINNNVNNPVKTTDKSINILTYNDIQSTKTEKKLNQYFFPSSTEIKSYLNGNGNSLLIEEAVLKNNQITSNAKIQNCKRETDKKEKTNSKVTLNDDFTPLNTRTYTFVSELNKSNVNFEQSSDSDYSTCRHTPGDSTDSESFHDIEDHRLLPKSSFLHGTYTSSSSAQINDSDIDKKYDAGSSTSGDISNFSDDSDTHDTPTNDRTSYKLKNVRLSVTPSLVEKKQNHRDTEHKFEGNTVRHHREGERNIQIHKMNERNAQNNSQKESSTRVSYNNQCQTKSTPKSKQCSPCSKRNCSLVLSSVNNTPAIPQTVNNKENLCKLTNSESKNGSPKYSPMEREKANTVSKSSSVPSLQTSPFASDSKKTMVPNNKESPKQEFGHETYTSTPKTAKEISGNDSINNLQDTSLKNAESERESSSLKISEENVTENDGSKEQVLENNESKDCDDHSDYEKSPEAINNRQSKLAALALELELARRDSESKANKPPSPPAPICTPEKAKFCEPIAQPSSVTSPESYPTIKKASAISCVSRLSTLPDVLQETPVKQKKTKFSLKKLLKRNKDSGTFSPSNKEVNPKAWKKQTFDRNRLSLEIVHPMDLTSDVPTSADSTPTEEHKQIVCTHPGKFMFRGVANRARSLSALPQLSTDEQSGCSLLDCRKTDTVPMRKAGTVAERKKNRVPETKSRSHSSSSSAQELHEQNHSDKEYANLGDIRSLLTPKKPQRPSAFSASTRGDSEIGPKKSEDIYETLPATNEEEEEDHYTYLDEAEVKVSKENEVKNAGASPKLKMSTETVSCGRPWLDLQTSYAAIAAANYESLAELITTSLNESAQYFKKVEPSLKWKNFILETKEEYYVIKDKVIYNAIYRSESQDKVTLVVAPRKHTTPQNSRNQTRYPVLASFNDHVPKNFISADNYILQESEVTSIYILQQSRVTTVNSFAKVSSSDTSNQYTHLRNYCFVLLQLIHTLKSLQAEGIEEINYDLQILILVVTDEDKPPILVLFPEDKTLLTLCDLSNRKTLCQATLETMLHFLQIKSIDDLKTCIINGEKLADPVAYTFKAIAKVLSEEKASSLSQAKGFLEYMLWGPVDVKISQNDSEDILDTILQRWLDLQRAQMVKSTISHLQNRKILHTGLHVYEEYQLIFLLQASVKSLKNVISKL